MTTTDTRTEADAIAELASNGELLAGINDVDDSGSPLAQRVYGRGPEGDTRLIETVDLERNRDVPVAKRGAITVHTPEALVIYASRHLDNIASTLWGVVGTGRITVVLNDHCDLTGGLAGWGDHRVDLQLRTSPEWDAWTALHEKWVGQETLAEFLDEHNADIVEPAGATMLEVARTFHATTGARFKRAQNQQSGEVQLVYEEDVEASAGKTGQTEVPREFVVRLRPFLGCDTQEVRGQFRYRVSEGALRLGLRLLNLDDIRREAVDEALTEVSDGLSLAAIHGLAPTARR